MEEHKVIGYRRNGRGLIPDKGVEKKIFVFITNSRTTDVHTAPFRIGIGLVPGKSR